jgi:flagellar biosynthetic protein FlhB
MADDSAERTEEPTARRLQRARDEGQVARSAELPAAGVMIGAVLMLMSLGGIWFHQLSVYFAAGFTLDRKFLDTPALLPQAFANQAGHAFLLVLPLMLVTMVVAILASGATGGFLFSWDAVLPKLSKLDPMAGLSRMFGGHAVVELLKSVLKFTLIAVVLLMLLLGLVMHLSKQVSRTVCRRVSRRAASRAACSSTAAAARACRNSCKYADCISARTWVARA